MKQTKKRPDLAPHRPGTSPAAEPSAAAQNFAETAQPAGSEASAACTGFGCSRFLGCFFLLIGVFFFGCVFRVRF